MSNEQKLKLRKEIVLYNNKIFNTFMKPTLDIARVGRVQNTCKLVLTNCVGF